MGTGSIGERHTRCFLQTGRAQVSICEIDDALRKKVVLRYDLKQFHSNLESALSDPPQAAVICTPAHLHIPMAIRLAKLGVHLLIEKPLSTQMENISHLEEIVLTKNLKAMLAYVYRTHPMLSAMRKAIHAGRFGLPVQVIATCGQHFPFYRPAYRKTYYTDRNCGGGAIQDALTHVVNAAEWIVGPITTLCADADHQVLQGVTVEDTVHVIARHEKIMASYCLNQYQAPNEVSLTLVCQEGTVRFEMHQNRWCWMRRTEEPWQTEVHALGRDTLFTKEAHAFLDFLEDKADPLCSLKEGIQSLKVNLAILKASRERTWQGVE